MKNVSPLLGFNNNIRYRGKMFHVQTEDSGVKHPHVITHLFTDGGRIIKTQKTSYAEELERDDLPVHVKRLMMDQHKSMFIALKEGQFDSVIVAIVSGPHVSDVASSLKEAKKGDSVAPPPRISAGLAAAAAAAAGRSSIPAARAVDPDEPPMPLPPPSGPVPMPAPAAANVSARPAMSPPAATSPSSPAYRSPASQDAQPPTPRDIRVAASNPDAAAASATASAPVGSAASPPGGASSAVSPPPGPVAPSPTPGPVVIPRPNRSAHGMPAVSGRLSPPPVPVAPQASSPVASPVVPPLAAQTTIPTPVPPNQERADTTYRTVIPAEEREKPRPASGRHAVSRPASIFASSKPSPNNASIFGEERISDKSLDEVILTYLAEDLDTPPPKK